MQRCCAHIRHCRPGASGRRWLSTNQPVHGDWDPPSRFWRWFHVATRVVRMGALGGGIFASGYAVGQQEVVNDVAAFEEKATKQVLLSTQSDTFLPLRLSQDPMTRARQLNCASYYYRILPGFELNIMRAQEETDIWKTTVQAHRVFSRVKEAAMGYAQSQIKELGERKKRSKETGEKWTEADQATLMTWRSTVNNLDMDWRIIGIEKDDPNAFVVGILPRRIFVTRSLAQHFAKTDEEMALVLSHELSHYLLRHTESRALFDAAVKGVLMVALSLFDPSGAGLPLALEWFLPYIGNLLSLSASRSSETEADTLGLEITARAGYDPCAAVNLFANMHEFVEKGQGQEFISQGVISSVTSSHPLSKERFDNAQKEMPRVIGIYEAAANRRSVQSMKEKSERMLKFLSRQSGGKMVETA